MKNLHWASEHPARYGLFVRVKRLRLVVDWQFGNHRGLFVLGRHR